jgi:hypothetical protein
LALRKEREKREREKGTDKTKVGSEQLPAGFRVSRNVKRAIFILRTLVELAGAELIRRYGESVPPPPFPPPP